MEEKDRIKWHPGFASAIKLEFHDNRNDLEYSEEVVLNKEVIRVDMLIIKKKPGVILKNPLGEHFRQHNILEFKSANDDLNIDTLFNVIGYACLYKSYGKTIDAIPFYDVTITLIRKRTPKGLLSYIGNHGGSIEYRSQGIYDIKWYVPFPVRIIVNRFLDFHQHTWLAAIRNDLTIEELKAVIEKSRSYTDKDSRISIDSAMSVISQANTVNLEETKKEDSEMCKELMDLMKPEIDAVVNEATNSTTASHIRNLMRNMNIDAKEAMTALGISVADFPKYLSLL